MLKQILLPTIALAFFITPFVGAQVVIKPRPQAPGTFETQVTLNLTQKLTIMGQELDTGQSRKATTKTVVSQPDSDGNITYSVTNSTFENTMTLPGGIELKYDSKGENKPQGTQVDFLIPVFDALAKATTTIVYDKEGGIKSIKIKSEELDKLDEQAKALVGSDLDSDTIEANARNELDEFRSEAVKPGDRWEDTTTMNLGGGAVFELDVTKKYVGVVIQDGKKLHKVEASYTDVDFEQPAPSPGAPAVTDSDLEITTGTAILLFDAEKGQVVSNKMTLNVKGAITLTVANMDLPAELKLDMSISNDIK